MKRYSEFMDRKIQYCLYVSSIQFGLYIQCNPSQNHNKIFCGHQNINYAFHIKRQKKPRVANIVLKEKDKVGRLRLPNFKT